MKPNTVIAVVGPTASGKSELAIRIAKKIKGEVISADSRQVYEYLDIGTAKVNGRWLGNKKSKVFKYKGVPHHCIDFVSPKETYSVAEFKKCAEHAIKDIYARGKIPIVVGGTGFWIDTLVYDLNLPEVPPNFKLRRQLEKKSTSALFNMLKKLDSKRAKTIDKANPRRLIRAIEIAKKLGSVPTIDNKKSKYQTIWIGLNPGKNILEKNISHRTHKMVEGNLIPEIKHILKLGVSKKRIREFGFEYRSALNYLESNITKKELITKLNRDTLHYAKQQMRWFKHNKNIVWFASPKSVSLAKLFISI